MCVALYIQYFPESCESTEYTVLHTSVYLGKNQNVKICVRLWVKWFCVSNNTTTYILNIFLPFGMLAVAVLSKTHQVHKFVTIFLRPGIKKGILGICENKSPMTKKQ